MFRIPSFSARQLPSTAAARPKIYENQTEVQDACNVIGRRPWDADAYIRLGDALRADEPAPTVPAAGAVALTKKECYRKATEIKPDDAHGFYHLGLLLAQDEEVCSGTGTLTQKICFVKAAELNPDNVQAFHRLAALLSADERIVIGDRSLSQKDCLAMKGRAVTSYMSFNQSIFSRGLFKTSLGGAGAPSSSHERASEGIPIMEETRVSADRAESQMRESYTIPTLDEHGDIGTRDVSTADLEPEFAENLHNILSLGDGYRTLVRILENAKRLNDIASSDPHVQQQMAPPAYIPPQGNVRIYYQTFNQAMECMFCTAQVVTSGLIPLKKSTALSAAIFANRTINLGMPNVISAGLLCLVRQKQDTKTLNNLSKILQLFHDTDQLKQVSREVSKAICITQENALNGYAEERDAAASSDLFTAAKGLTSTWLPKPFRPAKNKLVAAAENGAKNAELQAQRHLEATPMGRKALRDIHQILDAIIALSDEKFAEMDDLAPAQRTKSIVAFLKEALHVQGSESNDEETKRAAPDPGKQMKAAAELSGMTKHDKQEVQNLKRLVAEMGRRLQEQSAQLKELQNEVWELKSQAK